MNYTNVNDKKYSYTNKRRVALNEDSAYLMINQGKSSEAENLLRQNVDINTSSSRTYQMLIGIYNNKSDYNNLVKIINRAIKCCNENNKDFKELRRIVVLNKLLKDIPV